MVEWDYRVGLGLARTDELVRGQEIDNKVFLLQKGGLKMLATWRLWLLGSIRAI